MSTEMNDRRPLLVRDPFFREHVSDRDHPECPARLDAIDRALAPLSEDVREIEARKAGDEEILRAHDAEYLDLLRRADGGRGRLDADTYYCERSVEVARLAAGSTVDLALRVARGEAKRALSLVRPPGHHAEPGRAMGFCLLNQVAIATQALREEAGVERVAIVDWDVHHGNGTQRIFEAERDVLFLSLHQYPFYPGSGGAEEQGVGRGEGSTVNLPIPEGAGDAEYALAFDAVVAPIVRAFGPDVLVVSAGFDAHHADPLSGLRVTTRGFERMASVVRELAEDCCGGRLVLALEGGYDLEALGESVRVVVETLAAPAIPEREAPSNHRSGIGLAEQILRVHREAHETRWPCIRRPTHG